MPAPKRPTVPPAIVDRLRPICLGLPGTREEAAWAGTRWCVRDKTFAHVLQVEAGWPPAYARALGRNGPCSVLTFRSPLRELDAFAFGWAPFFKPAWFRDIVGMTLDARTDWDEVAGLVRASHRHLAPAKLTRSPKTAPS
jgi:predicted DNA-binding protein (MmcQ/YjbR family)